MRSYFDNGATLSIEMRIEALKKLKSEITNNIGPICEALNKDFHKPEAEVILTEVYPVLSDLNHTISKIKKWSKPESRNTNILLIPSSSKIIKSPKGLVLIISPWNYPFYLSMMPLISAIAAGNVAILKPANETYNTSLIIKSIIESSFKKEHVCCVTGDGKITGELLLDNYIFNHLFFTGSARVGKWMMEKASKNLIPITLELGGKSPSIIEKGYDLKLAAKKIVWGKFINAGQTCVSTDYVLVHKDDVDRFVNECKKEITSLFGEDVFNSKNYAHIINDIRFEKVVSYLSQGNVLFGGKHKAEIRCIEPTLIIPNNLDEPIMKEEIFGPVLPIISYENENEIINVVRKNRYPLALYIFNKSSAFEKYIFERIEFGGGCNHNTIYHLGNPNLPFGGIQASGLGTYHGIEGFNTFSNMKSVLKSKKWFDIPLLYQPYTASKLKILRKFFNA
jgi:aldehyde dehydrogenase (NAD+)